MRKILYLPIEIKKRELLPKLFLGLSAINKGFNFVIGNKTSIFAATDYFGPGVYFYKSMNFNDTSHIKSIKEKNNIYVVHDEESGVTHSTRSTFNNFINIRSSKENINLIDRFFTWGKFDHSAWVNKYKKYKNKFKMTGSPRLDLCISQIHENYLSDEINQIKKKYNRFILFISSGVSSDKELKNIFKQDKFFFKYKKKIEKKNRVVQMKNLRRYFKSSIDMIKYISTKFQEMNIVIRPHPNENINDWKKILKDLDKNIFLDLSSTDITSLIKGSECVIHNSSFSGIQASLLKKPIVIFSPKKINLSKRNFPNKLGYEANSKKKTLLLLKNILKSKKKFNENNFYKKTLTRVNFSKYKTASEKIVNDISKFKINKSRENNVNINFYSKYLFLKNYIKKKINYKGTEFERRYTRRSMSEKLGGGISKRDIMKYIKIAKKNNKKFKNVNLKSFGPNGFFIYIK